MDLQFGSILKEGFFYFSIIIMLVGILLAAMPGFFIEKSKNYNAWVDTDKYFEYANQTRKTEKYFYRHSRFLGVLIFFMSTYVLYTLTFEIESKHAALLFSFAFLPEHLSQWLAEAAIYILIFFNVVAFALSFILFFRPSSLKDLEAFSNTWFKSDAALHALDKSIDVTESTLTATKLRILGVIVVFACFYILFFLY